MKHTLRRKHPRRKYQIKTKKSKKLRFNKGRRMVGGFSAAFISYIHFEIAHIRKMANHKENAYGFMVRAIPSGAFTNKMDETGNGKFDKDINLDLLLKQTRMFYEYTNMLNAKALLSLNPASRDELMAQPPIVLYRHVNVPVDQIHVGQRIIQPIPMSCTWSIEFAISWMHQLHNSCCLYEITIPATAAFLPLSTHHDPAEMPVSPAVPLNQRQLELSVAPCVFTITGMRPHNYWHENVQYDTTMFQLTAQICATDAEVIANFNHVCEHGSFA
jgi:hypothetical protein